MDRASRMPSTIVIAIAIGTPGLIARSVVDALDPWTYSVSAIRAWIVGITRGSPSSPTHARWQ
jgi:hypothetical protein